MTHLKAIAKKVLVSMLTLEAQIVLRRHKPKIVAVTGSVGKTSTKDAIYSVLSGTYRTRKSDKSFNSEIGVPLTVLGIKNPWSNPLQWVKALYEGFVIACFSGEYPEWLVLEVGADHPGDIVRITKWIRPDIAVLTAVPNVPVHVEFFPSTDAVLTEKKALIDGMRGDGIAIIDIDSDKTRGVAESLAKNKATFGFDGSATSRVSTAAVVYNPEGVPTGMEYEITTDTATYAVPVVGMVGAHLALSIAAAIAVAEYLNISKEHIEERLSVHETPQGRMRLLRGKNNSVLIDDTYNASPYATKAALATLRDMECKGKKIAILGDMSELGKHAGEAHADVGECAASVVQELVTVGARARGIAEAAIAKGMRAESVHEFRQGDWNQVSAFVQAAISEGDIVLIKGSQSTRLEKVVAHLLLNSSDADKLVRQDEEWKKI